ncbi:TPA: hypothetical protein ACKFTV_002221 [Klebsiella pneumoniae]|uniref:hypothetical protein n=1 Tax=Klebsiella pneumoniae complex TaxID=3390273 RepID=UPI0011502209|nr:MULTISPECIES: hypothetical protein [Klebsiella]HCA9839073.1 hypothetical protein [Klebsiella variicola subsp. variicola]MCP2565382.1 hypothetical protein [Klebsiella pneumoniae]MCQ0997626.1 hypothetical protein [Klebsiella pneumoniae]MCQ1002374.1 hypothetical protein [Klebsiella pneumoniae]MDQ6443108.1 hypothetical protein [Klebsiella quasipneumoniae]
MSGLLTQVKGVITKSLNNIEPLRRAMKISSTQSLFSLVGVTQEYTPLDYATIPRQQGDFGFEFLISSTPNNPLPPETFDVIVGYVLSQTKMEFKEAGIVLIGLDFGNSTIVDDPTTGRISLVFTINIIATLKR